VRAVALGQGAGFDERERGCRGGARICGGRHGWNRSIAAHWKRDRSMFA
jgi:hypothetical protein